MIITIIIRMKIYAKEGREVRRVRTICRSADHLPQPPGPFYEAEDTEVPDHAHRGQSGQIHTEEGSLQGRLESEPVSSMDRDSGTRVRLLKKIGRYLYLRDS